MVQRFDEPTLTPDQRAYLRSAKDPLDKARAVFRKLEAIGIDVSEDMAQVERVEQVRAGLLDQFGTQRGRRING